MRPGVPPFRRRPSCRTDVLVACAAITYLAWSLVPLWYQAPAGTADGPTLPAVSLNAWGGPTASAAVLALVAAAWVGARAGRELRHPGRVMAVDAALAGVALLLTLAGLLFHRPGSLGPSVPGWGLAVGVAIAVAWAIAAGRGLREVWVSGLRHP